MATRKPPVEFILSRDAGADLTGQQNKVVVLNTSGKFVLSGAATAGLRGILLEGFASGRGCTVQFAGQAAALCGATFTAGVSVASNASGLLVLATTGQAAVGFSLSAGASGVFAEIVVHPHAAP